MKKGFSLIELLIVIAVLMIILVLSIVAFYTLTKKTDLDTSRDNIISALNLVRNKTLASEEAAQYGVYFDATAVPDRYVLFQGPSYTTRNVSLDKIYNFPSVIEISSVSLEGENEIVFNRLQGDTNNYGSITIRSLKDNEIRTIYIYSSGEISTQPESVSGGAGRITDSRHVHFTYTRNIVTSIEIITLTFADPTTIINIPMADYTTSVSFDWEDDVDVGGDIEKIRIHTHWLNNPDAQFCVHRDRKYNNKSLIITISGDGSGSLISYTINGQESRGTSIYLTTGEAGDPQRQ